MNNKESLPGRSAELLMRTAGESRDRVEAFHFSRLETGFSLRIPEGAEVAEPIILRFKGAPDGGHEASFAHIHAEQGSTARVFILLEDLPEAATLRTAGFHFELDEGSSLQAAVLQDLSHSSRFFSFHSADVAGGADFSFSEIDLGAALSVSAPVFNTRGKEADIDITGLYAVAAGQHKNMRPVQRHAEPHGSSTSLYKGALVPGGRTVFQGLIRVEPGAVKTDAYLSNKNLLMADGARADSIPSLQILNNDVRCTHGSTTGKLDPEQVFYLQSRGFDRLEAERMLLWGFYEDALGKLPGEAAGIVRERLEAHPLFSGAKE